MPIAISGGTDGIGPGQGRQHFAFDHPDDPLLNGLSFYVQSLINDSENAYGTAISQGLHVLFGE